MFTAWNNQYCCEVSSSHLSLCQRHIQSCSNEEFSKIFCGYQNADLQVYLKTQKGHNG